MFTAEIVMAAALIAGPATPNDRGAIPNETAFSVVGCAPGVAEVLRPQILAVALADEIMDPREKGHMMSADVAGDLATLRQRWRELETAPPLEAIDRFPDRKLAIEALGINRHVRDRLAARRAVDLMHEGELLAAIIDVERRYVIWDALRDSHQPYYFVTVRRAALALLRDLIGDEAFYAGRMPAPMP